MRTDPVLGSAVMGGLQEDPMSTEARSDAPETDEQRSRVLIEAVTDYAIYMLDPHGIVTSWNRGAQRFKGYTPDEIVGEHFSRFYTEEDRKSGLPMRALETAAREGRFEQEGWRVRKDGGRFWAHVVIDPIRDEQRTLIGFAKITRTSRSEGRPNKRWRRAAWRSSSPRQWRRWGSLNGRRSGNASCKQSCSMCRVWQLWDRSPRSLLTSSTSRSRPLSITSRDVAAYSRAARSQILV